jgi:hypothetical protein
VARDLTAALLLSRRTDPTGYNPGFGQFNAPSPAPSQTKDVSPANIFAQMKSGTFGDDSAPQGSGMFAATHREGRLSHACLDRYDALRPQPAGFNGYQQTGYGYR